MIENKFEKQLEALNNATARLGIEVHLVSDFDKRKSPKFCFTEKGTSISGKMDYECANMFILGYMRGGGFPNY